MSNSLFDRPIEFAIVCAVAEEFQALILNLTEISNMSIADKNVAIGFFKNKKIVIIESGIGNINAALATSAIICKFNPKFMLFSGIAGALNLAFKPGDVIVGSSAFQAEAMSHEQLRETWEIPSLDKAACPHLLKMAESLYGSYDFNIKTGVIVSSDIYPAPKNYADLIKAKSAEAIDMETAAFYQTSTAFAKPCLSIRSFSNTVTNSDQEVLVHDLIKLSSSNSARFSFGLITQMAKNIYLNAPAYLQ